MRPLRFFGTMGGRLFLFLLVGVAGSALLALVLADRQRQSDLHRIRFERLIDRISDFLTVSDKATESLRAELMENGVTGIRRATGKEQIQSVDTELEQRLDKRWGKQARVERAVASSCFGTTPIDARTERFECWVVTAPLSDGRTARLQVRGHVQVDSIAFNPAVVIILTALMATLALIAARIAAAPLGELARAAKALGDDLDRHPLPERGPREVREAARAFNQMQSHLRSHVVERTQLLASITHDLQTPMTRLRLRLEKVSDPALRSRLIDDLGTMQALIREGLDYARSAETAETFARLDIDQLLDLVVEDAAEEGKPVAFVARSGCDVEVRPRALQRCLTNLIDNALKYGGSAEVAATPAGDTVEIRIRDHGPGIAETDLAGVFAPFVRLEAGRVDEPDGIGLGLTIAKSLAGSNDADLALRNHPEGGLEALLILRRGVVCRAGTEALQPG